MGTGWVLGLLLAFGGAARAQQEIPLWPNGAPGATGTGSADKPGITPYPASNPNGAAVVVIPGGAYSFLATDIEGTQPAKWLQSQGISAFVVKYRVSPYRHPIEMWDGQRAMRWVRANAKKYGIDTAHIGVMGFSAGGHMASTVSTHWDTGNPSANDSVDRQSCRPAFAIIHYGVITMDASFTHMGSRQSLLGNNPSQALVDSMSNEKQVNAKTPPTFLGHGDNDHTVNVKNSQVYYDSLQKKGVTKSTLMIFKGVDHSYGLADGKAGTPNNPTIHAWCDSSLRWLDSQGFLTRTVVSLSPASPSTRAEAAIPEAGLGFLLPGRGGSRFDALGRPPRAVRSAHF
jgi:acetyl esterase/lipase